MVLVRDYTDPSLRVQDSTAEGAVRFDGKKNDISTRENALT